MQKRNLLIIHQGALGDFVAAIPAMIRLKKNYSCVDVLCSGQLGKLAREIGLAEQCFPLEAAGFSSIYTEIVDEKVKQLLQDYVTVILFSNRRYNILQIEMHRAGVDSPGPKALGLTELSKPALNWCESTSFA